MSAVRSRHAFPSMSSRDTAFGALVPVGGVRSASAGAPFALRLKVYLTRARLDRELASGHAQNSADELALRARHLTNPRTQREIARNLRGVVRYADRHGPGGGLSCVLISSRSVKAGRLALCELAEQLERAAPVNPRGVVLVRDLLTAGDSPLFNPDAERSVAEAAREIRDALEEYPTITHFPLGA